MTSAQFLAIASELDADAQKELIEKISVFCSSEEVTALLVGIGYFRMISDEKLKKAMQDAVREQLFCNK